MPRKQRFKPSRKPKPIVEDQQNPIGESSQPSSRNVDEHRRDISDRTESDERSRASE